MSDTLLCPTGEIFPVSPKHPDHGYTLDELRTYTRAQWIEVVPVGDGKILIVDEEGLLRGGPINPTASRLAGGTIRGFAVLAESGNVQ